MTPRLYNNHRAVFGYIGGLDGLRLVAVSIVILAHYHIVPMMPGGFGVAIFFFISGLLISRLMLAEEKGTGTINLRNFYIRRLIRLLPPLMLMGAVAVPMLYWLDPGDFSSRQIWLSFLYLGNIYKIGEEVLGWPAGYRAFQPLWSLAVEEHFYLLLPLLLAAVRDMRARIGMIVFVLVAAPLLRAMLAVLAPDAADSINYHFTLTRIDAIAWGVLLTLLLEGGMLPVRVFDRYGGWLLWGGAAAMIVSMVHWWPFYEVALKYTALSVAITIGFGALIFSAKARWLRSILDLAPIRHLGRISYELYLWHLPILTAVSVFMPSKTYSVIASILITLVVSDMGYRLTTKRIGRLRKAFGGHPV